MWGWEVAPELAGGNAGLRGENRYAALRQTLGFRKTVQDLARAGEQMRANDIGSRGIDQIPVVDELGVLQVESENRAVPLLLLGQQNLERHESMLVNRRG